MDPIPPTSNKPPNPITNPLVGEKSEKEKPTSSNPAQIEQKKSLLELSPEKYKTLGLIRTFFLTPTCFLSAGAGALSFFLSNAFKAQNDFVDKIAAYSSKAAVFGVGIFNLLHRFWKKDSFGTLAFATDLATSTFADGEDLYQWKGFGSGLDHSPLILGEAHSNQKVKDKYKSKDSGELTKDQFLSYSGFLDSAKKMCYSVYVIFGDIINEFKTNGFANGFMNCFVNKNKRKAEKNLLISGLGIITGAFLGTILGFKKIGATIRDVFGIYADWAYVDKGQSEASGDKNSEHQKNYTRSGILYTIGSLLDLAYRWTDIENLNLLALGIDRLGARDATLGLFKESESNNGNGNHTTEQQPAPALAAVG